MIRLLIVEPDATFAHKVADEARRLDYVPVLMEDPTLASDLLASDELFDLVLVSGDIEPSLLHQIVRSVFARDLLAEIVVTGQHLLVAPVVTLMRMGVSNVVVREGDPLAQVELTMSALRESVRSREQDAESLRRVGNPS